MFDYKKQSFKFIVGAFLAFILLILIYVGIIFTFQPLYTKAEYWVQDAINVKLYNYELRDKEKNSIIILAGSNALYGIHTPTLSANVKSNYNIVNFGLHAGIAIEFYYALARQVVNDGDILIMPLEYAYIKRKNILSEWDYAQFTTWASDYAYALPKNIQKDIMLKNFATYWQRFGDFFKPFPVTNIEKLREKIKHNTIVNFNDRVTGLLPSGELLLDLPNEHQYDGNYLSSLENVSSDFLLSFRAFYEEMKERNVQIYITYPVSQKNKEFDLANSAVQEDFIEYIQIYKDMNIPIFGTVDFYNLDVEYFFDTAYHLNAQGSILRSLLMAEDINTFIFKKEPSYKPGESEIFMREMDIKAQEIKKELHKQQEELQNS